MSVVSVVIPAYNAAATIAGTLGSLLAQTFSQWEAIVVDDGSGDGTGEAAAGAGRGDARIRIVRQQNGGEAAARNAGLALASHDWLLFLDADDWIAPQHLAVMTGALASDPALDAVICAHARIAADGTATTEPYQPPAGDLFGVLARRAAFPVHACVVRRALVEEVGGFDPSLKTSPDWDMWQRVARTGAQFGVVSDVLAFYRMSATGASLDGRQLLKDGLRVLRQGHGPDPRVRRPHPAHANGVSDPVQTQEFYLLAWCAGLLLGSGQDPAPLFELVGRDQFSELYAPATAQCVFEAAPLPTQRSARAWETLWPALRPRLEEFFAALEAHSNAQGLAPRALTELKRMMVASSPYWDLMREMLDAQEARITAERADWTIASAGYERALQESRDLAKTWEADAHARAAERDEAGSLARAQESRAERLQDQIRAVEGDRDHWRQAADERQGTIEALRQIRDTLERERGEWQARAQAAESDALSQRERIAGLDHALGESRSAHGELERTHQALASGHDQLSDQRAVLEHEKGELLEVRSQLERHLQDRDKAIDSLHESLASMTMSRDATQQTLAQRTAERDAVQQSFERRLGDLLLNRWRLRRPAEWAAGAQASLRQRVTLAGLAVEGRARRRRSNQVLATACDVFPIYSQTFVYQELTQLLKHGFDVRFVYSKLDARDRLATPFAALWDTKRQLHLNDAAHRADYARYQRRMPEKVTQLIARLSAASGMSAAAIEHHGNFLQAFTFTRMVEAYRPDYLHSYFFYDRSLMALIASFLLDIPRGVSCYADHAMQDYELKVVPLHMELCDIVIATSERIKCELLTIAPQMDEKKILVKPNGVDTVRFPALERHEPAVGQPFRLVTVCRIEPKKGLLDLVDAVALLRRRGINVEAHIVGTVDEWSQASLDYKTVLDSKISELDLWGKVHLEGRHGYEGISRFLGLAHLFVAPFVETNTGDKDGIPTALLEGMSTGLAAVGTDAGSIAEVIDDQCGLVTPQRDPGALAGAIGTLLADPTLRSRMSQAAAARVRQRFDAEKLERLFHDRIRTGPLAPGRKS